MTYTPPPGEEIPVESHVAVALTVRGLTGGMQDEHRAARQLIADLAKVGVVIGDMQQWRRNFLRGHVAGENEDHRLAGVIADQADELDADRVRIAELELVADAARALADEPDRSKFEHHLAVLEERVASLDAVPAADTTSGGEASLKDLERQIQALVDQYNERHRAETGCTCRTILAGMTAHGCPRHDCHEEED